MISSVMNREEGVPRVDGLDLFLDFPTRHASIFYFSVEKRDALVSAFPTPPIGLEENQL